MFCKGCLDQTHVLCMSRAAAPDAFKFLITDYCYTWLRSSGVNLLLSQCSYVLCCVVLCSGHQHHSLGQDFQSHDALQREREKVLRERREMLYAGGHARKHQTPLQVQLTSARVLQVKHWDIQSASHCHSADLRWGLINEWPISSNSGALNLQHQGLILKECMEWYNEYLQCNVG